VKHPPVKITSPPPSLSYVFAAEAVRPDIAVRRPSSFDNPLIGEEAIQLKGYGV
jgi:hypothetical protein